MTETTAEITALSDIDTPLVVTNPIRITIRRGGDDYFANAPDFGRLMSGKGRTPEEAIADLKRFLGDMFLKLENTRKAEPLNDWRGEFLRKLQTCISSNNGDATIESP
ncbi:hypothetical protein COU80_02880 [Candidatus Peregrinibacteria bacterium CG10_big_fil_rev_8_21_14_0_10_55_24]|nr:MAG: hypothetical protein COU80_02880 [Candidatus Peregrinibacteria bacterium CG10_big_fil_rev_8_21_14_0_10_55_24]